MLRRRILRRDVGRRLPGIRRVGRRSFTDVRQCHAAAARREPFPPAGGCACAILRLPHLRAGSALRLTPSPPLALRFLTRLALSLAAPSLEAIVPAPAQTAPRNRAEPRRPAGAAPA